MFRYKVIAITGLIGLIYFAAKPQQITEVVPTTALWGLDKQKISEIVSPEIRENKLPQEIVFEKKIDQQTEQATAKVFYTIDEPLQDKVSDIIKRYRPDYAMAVVMEADTGRILSMNTHLRDQQNAPNMTLDASYPAASISKIITTVAGVNDNLVNIDTVIPFNGRSTTLYKTQVFKHKDRNGTRKQSLKTSFAKSVNPVFGRLGAEIIGADRMLHYADELGFNQGFNSDFEFDAGSINVDPNNLWHIVEMASGYTTNNTLSPVHGAVIGALAVNGGHLQTPNIIDHITDENGIILYDSQETSAPQILQNTTADQLRRMMQETIRKGSARKQFSRFPKKSLKGLIAGGKTGSLTGFKPRGRYDWFVGFAEHNGKAISYAVLCINKEKWYVKSAQLAREIIEYYYSRDAV